MALMTHGTAALDDTAGATNGAVGEDAVSGFGEGGSCTGRSCTTARQSPGRAHVGWVEGDVRDLRTAVHAAARLPHVQCVGRDEVLRRDLDDATGSDDDDDQDGEGNDGEEALTDGVDKLVDAADEADSDEAEDRDSDEELESDHMEDIEPLAELQRTPALRKSRNIRVVSDDEDTEHEPKIATRLHYLSP